MKEKNVTNVNIVQLVLPILVHLEHMNEAILVIIGQIQNNLALYRPSLQIKIEIYITVNLLLLYALTPF